MFYPHYRSISSRRCVLECIYIYPIGSMYGIYANIGGILMVNVTIYSIHGSYGYGVYLQSLCWAQRRTGSGRLSRIRVGLIPNAFSKSRRQKRHPAMCFWNRNMHWPEKDIHFFDVVWWCLIHFNSVPHQNCHLRDIWNPFFQIPNIMMWVDWCH